MPTVGRNYLWPGTSGQPGRGEDIFWRGSSVVARAGIYLRASVSRRGTVVGASLTVATSINQRSYRETVVIYVHRRKGLGMCVHNIISYLCIIVKYWSYMYILVHITYITYKQTMLSQRVELLEFEN